MASTPKFKFTYLLLALLFIACKNKTATQKAVIKKKTQTATTQKKAYDTLITTPLAVVLYPTRHQLDSMKKKDGEDFYTIVDDDQFYLAECQQYLDSVKLKTLIKDAKGLIAFKNQNNEVFTLRLDTMSWHVILFDGKTKPYSADVTMFADEYKLYMK